MNENIINCVSLFEDLKDTNLKMSDFKEIIASYKTLENEYIKNNQVDLLRDLNRQKKVIFSYFNKCFNASLKKTASMVNEINKEFYDFDKVDTFNSPNKDIQLVKIAYKNGKWTVGTKNLSEDLIIKDIPQGINNLVGLVDRLDEQEAAYALSHAKTAGKFTIATLPYVRTDMPDVAWTTRYMKEPTVPLGPYEKSEDSVSTHNMPVSRQIAGEGDEILLGDKIETNDGEIYEIIAISENQIITSTNKMIDKMLAEGKLENGEWKKIESAKEDEEDIRITRIKQKADKLTAAWEEKLILDEAIERLVVEYRQKLLAATEERRNKLEEARAVASPKLQKLAAKIEAIRVEDEKAFNKFIRLKEVIGQFILNFTRKHIITKVQKLPIVEKVLEKMEKLVAPRNLEKFRQLEQELFNHIEQDENFDVTLNLKDPRNEEKVEEEKMQLKKTVKTSQNSEFERDAAYKQLEDMLINGDISFKDYSDFTDFVDINAKQVLASIKNIKSSFIEVKADFTSDIWNKIKELYDNIKNWITDTLSFLTIQEKEVKDLNEDLDKILED